MKSIFFVLLVGLPFLGFGQVVDTVAVGREVDSLVQVNRKLVGERRFEEALEVIIRATQKAGVIFGANSAINATCLFNHGRTFHAMMSYQQAESLYIEAKEIRAKVLGTEHPDYALSLNNLASLYMEKGNYEKAEPLYLEAIEIRAKSLGKKHLDYAISLINLASLYVAKNDYAKAEPQYLEAKEILSLVMGKEHLIYATSVFNLARLYQAKGDYAKAEPLYLEATAIRAKLLGKKHPDYASSLNNLANLYSAKGDYAKSEPILLEAKEIRKTVLGQKHPAYASSLNNLANLYFIKGDYSKAELLYLEGNEIQGKVLGKEHPDYAQSLNNLANLYQEIGHYEKAEQMYIEAIKIREKTVGKEHPDYAQPLSNLAILYKVKKDFAKAELMYLEIIEIYTKVFGKEHFDYAVSLSNLANLYLSKGDYSKAEPLYLESIEIKTKVLSKEHPDQASTLSSLAQLYQITNRILESTSLFLETNKVNRRLIEKSTAYSSENQMLAYLHTFQDDLAQFQSFSQAHSSPKLNQASFDNAIFFSGFLLENVRRLSISVATSDSLTRETFERWQGCRRRLANEYAKPVAKRTFVMEVESEAEGYEKILTRNLPAFSEVRHSPGWQEVRVHLPHNSAAVEFISYRYYTPKPTDSVMYAALVLLPSDTTPHFIPLFEERQLQALLNRPGLSEKLILKDLYGNSPELRRLIWAPLQPLLADVKTIYYSPSGLLHRINPGAILDESNQPLSEGRDWVRLGSTRELVTGRLADRSFARSPEDKSNSTLTAMVYGGITYDMDSLAFARANPAGAIDSTEMPLRKDGAFSYIISEQPDGSGTRGNPDGTWSTLVATSKEADEVSAMLAAAGFSTQKKQGFYASEEQFKQVGVNTPSPRVLHLATHGFSYPDPKKTPPKGFADSEPTYKMLDDPMLRSGLVLAGANYYWKNKRPLTNREDGVLVAYEVRDLNLRNTELAVLSACQTGVGDVVGSEGVYGLQRAFRIAGAKFLIVSLWQVPDEQTQELMRLFYQNWLDKKESLRDAFNHAQQALREKEPSPFMWAGFVLVE
jgi:tetratricopeptide (TPR) repeat protein